MREDVYDLLATHREPNDTKNLLHSVLLGEHSMLCTTSIL